MKNFRFVDDVIIVKENIDVLTEIIEPIRKILERLVEYKFEKT